MFSDYMKAYRKGAGERRQADAERRDPYVPCLDELLSGNQKRQIIGLGEKEILLSQAIGTSRKDRRESFSVSFLPVVDPDSEFASKWSSVYDMRMRDGMDDPIDAYEYMHRFYVEEGNKRVSVAKFLEAPTIRARVQRILPPRTDEPANVLYYEFLEFYAVTSMYEIDFSHAGDYRKFAAMMGQDLQHRWPDRLTGEIRSAYAFFCNQYRKMGGRDLPLPESDAFFRYLHVYSMQHLLEDGDAILERQFRKLWNEFRIASNDCPVKIVDDPAELNRTERNTGLVRSLVGLVTRYSEDEYSAAHPLKIAFLYDKTPVESSWIYGHELGRNEITAEFGELVQVSRFDSCTGDRMLAAGIDQAVSDGCRMIFTTSPRQIEETLRSALHYQHVHFLNCSLNLSHTQVRTYYDRMYEAKFILGALAASLADSHRIAYLADYPIYGTMACINAFAAGAAIIDPYAEIRLVWACQEHTDWRQELKTCGAEIISGPDFIRPSDRERCYGLFRYDEAGRMERLAGPVLNWGTFYRRIVRSVLTQKWSSEKLPQDQGVNYWLGMEQDVVDIALSRRLPYQAVNLANVLRRAIREETLDPFEGEIRKKGGALVRAAGDPPFRQEEIIGMSWLAENLQGDIPGWSELTPEAKSIVRISGIVKADDVHDMNNA